MTAEAPDRPEEWDGFIGDGEPKFVRVIHDSGDIKEHGDVYAGLSLHTLVISDDGTFEDTVTRYDKSQLAQFDIIQNRPMCFITTAVAADEPTLDALRSFRDDAMSRTVPGRALLRLYDAVSPSVAWTLARHPDARTTTAVRWLVEVCADLARRRERQGSCTVRSLLSLPLIVLYLVGIIVGVAGHLALSTVDLVTAGRRTERYSPKD